MGGGVSSISSARQTYALSEQVRAEDSAPSPAPQFQGKLKHILAPYKDEVLLNVENPGDRQCIRRSMNFLSREPSAVVLIGKSLGGVRTCWMLKKNAAELAKHRSVSVILIDPHGWQVGDGMIGSYGQNQAFPHCEELARFHVVNFYQHNRWPHGAIFDGEDSNRRLGPRADHWNVTDVESPESEPIRNEILRAVKHRRS